MEISIAQTRPIKGDISANIENHKKLVRLAVDYKAQLIFFPELSVTGYEPKLANALATSEDDDRFSDLQEISDRDNITIGIGMPILAHSGVQIGMVVIQPRKPRQRYSKQQLHADELPFFVKGEKQMILPVGTKRVAPAICYESLQPEHCGNAVALGAELYVASVAKSQKGIDKALLHFPKIALKYSIPVLMSNAVGLCDNFESVGTSSAWGKSGDLLAQLDNKSEGILFVDTETEEAIKLYQY